MTDFMIVEPLRPVSVVGSRGTGAANLATIDPKEAWLDVAGGGSATLTVDLGQAQSVDTIYLGYLRGAAPIATWSITGGADRADQGVLLAATTLRVPDVAGSTASTSCALATIAVRPIRYLAITINQPAGAAALSAGVLVVGAAFRSALGQEWGAGRRPIDTGSATALSSGGFAIVEGIRKRALSWTFGDLSIDEADRLERIAMACGETGPVLIVEDSARTAGLIARIHYAKFDRWRGFERRNRAQTRWEISVEQWA